MTKDQEKKREKDSDKALMVNTVVGIISIIVSIISIIVSFFKN